MGGMQRKYSNFFFEIARFSHMASAFLFPHFVIRFTRGSFQYKQFPLHFSVMDAGVFWYWIDLDLNWIDLN